MSYMIAKNSKKFKDHEDEEPCLSGSGELQYIGKFKEGGMSKILRYSLSKDGCQSDVVVKTLFQKSVSER